MTDEPRQEEDEVKTDAKSGADIQESRTPPESLANGLTRPIVMLTISFLFSLENLFCKPSSPGTKVIYYEFVIASRLKLTIGQINSLSSFIEKTFTVNTLELLSCRYLQNCLVYVN